MGASRRVLAASLAAVAFPIAAGAGAASAWVVENAVEAGRMGTWSKPVSYDAATGAQTFPIARPDAYVLSSVTFNGETEFTSLEGSYTSGRQRL